MGANACSVSFGGSIPLFGPSGGDGMLLGGSLLAGNCEFSMMGTICAPDISLVELTFGCLNKGLTD